MPFDPGGFKIEDKAGPTFAIRIQREAHFACELVSSLNSANQIVCDERMDLTVHVAVELSEILTQTDRHSAWSSLLSNILKLIQVAGFHVLFHCGLRQ